MFERPYARLAPADVGTEVRTAHQALIHEPRTGPLRPRRAWGVAERSRATRRSTDPATNAGMHRVTRRQRSRVKQRGASSLLVVASFAALIASCTTAESDGPPSDPLGTAASPAAVDLAPLPDDAAATCQRVPQLRAVCPALIPAFEGVALRSSTFRQGRHWTFTSEGGTGPYANPRRNRPPGFVHVVAQSGELSDAFETFTYTTSDFVTVRDGLMGSAERRRLAALGRSGETPMGLFLGKRTWNRHHGGLVLAPPFTAIDSIHADHLIFLWRSDGRDRAVSLHAWEPFTESLATLRAVVDSMPTDGDSTA